MVVNSFASFDRNGPVRARLREMVGDRFCYHVEKFSEVTHSSLLRVQCNVSEPLRVTLDIVSEEFDCHLYFPIPPNRMAG